MGIHSRHQVLALLERKLLEERNTHRSEITSLKKMKTLSAENIAYNVEKHERSIEQLTVLIARARQLKQNREPLRLFVYQQRFLEPPTSADECHLGTEGDDWKGSASVDVRPECRGKRTGARWTVNHPRAEADEHFHLVFR